MFTHLAKWRSRVEIDQRAREGRLRQEWREAPNENDRVSISVERTAARVAQPRGSGGVS